MATSKKRKSDINIDICASENDDQRTKKEKPWFEEQTVTDGSSRRKSFFSGMFKKMKSSSALKQKNTSVCKLDVLMVHDSTNISQTSESSATSAESTNVSLLPNVEKNVDLKLFVTKSTSFIPPVQEIKPEQDTVSMSSALSLDNGEDMSTSVFCTPVRKQMRRSAITRMSTRSVPEPRDLDDDASLTFNSVCNSVKRAPSTLSDKSFTPNGSTRRSMRHLSRKLLNASSMEDVPEEEALVTTTPRTLSTTTFDEEEEEEKFVDGREFFANNVLSYNDSTDEGQEDKMRVSITSHTSLNSMASMKSVNRKTPGSSIGRNNSILKKMFNGITGRERRASIDETHSLPASAHRSTLVSKDVPTDINLSAVMENPKMRKKTPSSSSFAPGNRFSFSNLFKKCKDDGDISIMKTAGRRNTLTGYSSTSSGIGSIASACSEAGTSNGKVGKSVSRNGSQREDEIRKERCRRFLDTVRIAKQTARECLSILKKRRSGEIQESEDDVPDCDVIAVDVNMDGTPFSDTSKTIVDERLSDKIAEEIRNDYQRGLCGSVLDHTPRTVFVCPQSATCSMPDPNESSISDGKMPSDQLLADVRNGVSKSVEMWNSAAGSKEFSTMLLYPMFCENEEEWDAPETIENFFKMLDAIMHTKRWRKDGKVVLAGITEENRRLIEEKYENMKIMLEDDEMDMVNMKNVVVGKPPKDSPPNNDSMKVEEAINI